MKMGIWALCLLFVIILMLFLFSSYLSDMVDKMNYYINMADNFVIDKNYEEAKKTYENIKTVWKKSKKRLQFQINKNDFDEINAIFSEIDAYLNQSFYEDYFQASYKLRFFINNLYEKNTLSFETIL